MLYIKLDKISTKKKDQGMYKNKALHNYISKQFTMHKFRANFLTSMILAIIKVRNIQQPKIAQAISSEAKTSSVIRCIQRFFEKEFLCPRAASRLIFSMFDWEEKITLTMDRTNWKFGKNDVNYLMICAVYKGISIPLCWILLPHQGSSNTANRIDLIEMLLGIIPVNRIKFLLADREFIGAEWFQYLKKTGIPFCIRLKESMLVIDTRRGGLIKLKKLLYNVAATTHREFHQKLSGVFLRVFATRTDAGELLILAISGDDNELDAFLVYRTRWSIETMFKAFKTSGFNLEDTHQVYLDRLCKIMILLSIAYSWAVKIGEIKNNITPVKTKNHGRPEFSFFRYGLEVIQTILLKGTHKFQQKLFNLLEKIALNKRVFPSLSKITVVY